MSQLSWRKRTLRTLLRFIISISVCWEDGLPYVRAGPLSPPVVGDTSIYDYLELWSNTRIEDILRYR
ncbi:MAG: hypothetical protein QXT53_07945 [Ignisphaera sp.]